MNWIEAIFLGLIQGLTEFLPVSSSGHLEIGKALFGIDASENFYFSLAVHGATVTSTLLVFRKEILRLLKGAFTFRKNEETLYVIKLVVSMIPVGIIGIVFYEDIKSIYNGNMMLVGFMLLFTAIFLFTANFIRKKERKIGYFDSLIIGLAQVLAVVPGISRSGITIATGMIIGNRRDELAKFSFLMVLVPVIGANLLEILKGETTGAGTSAGLIIAGSVTAFFAGYIACRWMISLVKKSKLIWFAVYCTIIGLLTIFIG